VAWILRLVKTDAEGDGPSTDVMEIDKPDDLRDVAHLGLSRKRCSATLGIVRGSGRVIRLPVPRHQFVDALLRPAVDEACQQIREIGLRIDAIEFAGLDQ
jgi:hypothetical protein